MFGRRTRFLLAQPTEAARLVLIIQLKDERGEAEHRHGAKIPHGQHPRLEADEHSCAVGAALNLVKHVARGEEREERRAQGCALNVKKREDGADTDAIIVVLPFRGLVGCNGETRKLLEEAVESADVAL